MDVSCRHAVYGARRSDTSVGYCAACLKIRLLTITIQTPKHSLLLPRLPLLVQLERYFLSPLFSTFARTHTSTALTGSQHLEEMLKENLIRSSPSTKLDNLYTAGLLYSTQGAARSAAVPTSEQSKQFFQTFKKRLGAESSPAPAKGQSSNSTNAQAEEVMLLQSWNGKLIAEQLGLPGMQLEIERAVEQVEASLEKQRQQRQSQDAPSGAATEKRTVTAQPQSRDTAR